MTEASSSTSMAKARAVLAGGGDLGDQGVQLVGAAGGGGDLGPGLGGGAGEGGADARGGAGDQDGAAG